MNEDTKNILNEIDTQLFYTKIRDSEKHKQASFTHFLHNHKNETSQVYKANALAFVKNVLSHKYPEHGISQQLTEEMLQYLIFKSQSSPLSVIPFPAPQTPIFSFIDLFAGIGGFRLAFQNLGGKCVFTSEWDKYAQKTYEANFGEVPFGDITKRETKNSIPDNFDILCAGFPCQAFSIAGRRGGFEDTRGTLFFDVAEIIKTKQPQAFFLENVKGLRNHDKGKTLATILHVLRKDLGYYVPEPRVINAKNFGVPQNRERIFIVGFHPKTGIHNFEYPEPTEESIAFKDIKEEQEVSVKYYLSDVYLNTLRKHKARHERKGNGFGYEIIADEGIANAVVCGGMGRERNLVYDDRLTNFEPITNISGKVNREGIRKMTPREWARLQGFPDEFKIVVSDGQAYKQFGNSVAVPAIQATAEQIIKKLNLNITC
ncbi:MAG: DNA cytosine methyltransferase [Bernardetiaceae bacterium]|nr:DNA cytosine methyltransferase [Bernardetiaceae bacterium]